MSQECRLSVSDLVSFHDLDILCRVKIDPEHGEYVFFTDGTYIHTTTFDADDDRSEWKLVYDSKDLPMFFYKHRRDGEWQCDSELFDINASDKIIVNAILLELSMRAMLDDK